MIFFDPVDREKIPSASLEHVFAEAARSQGIELRWLGLNAPTMNLDHAASDEFEKNAVKALASGKSEFETVEQNRYRRVGAIVCITPVSNVTFPIEPAWKIVRRDWPSRSRSVRNRRIRVQQYFHAEPCRTGTD